ncbi:hypothetical protein ACZ87_00675 [Candidatus Erwinia dacicola]|uniref:DUF3251 domain-containing protein n=1 Tax=Candidatus Erwinia dacicola TaxID=252393 RepID=A0A328TXM0_9GAMM|nr:hypothetical protein ACZ87_00675 [Candidatus Erwinia dacicola]
MEAEANGIHAILHIHATNDVPLPAFTTEVQWGELDTATGKPLTVDS